ncbi:hypothetical protein PYW08_015707 [Mythimna loreyi]|uniref:Uncharacterized protein n=1 Tax=Mythimna loreyi TaxID=667449 RepID=A0ACC2QS16_9NEOP|nr:hypothetical protein PYW08_015707 [Mythimna loreyi]
MSDTWKVAMSPNYEINKDKLYPYSEMPFQKEYKLVKIPICVRNLIEHVDYFGYGKMTTNKGTSGFADCYNINYEYETVFDGSDKGRKIPNRIPMIQEQSRFGYSTCNYLNDNSVLTVTVQLNRWRLVKYLAQDIARVVNSEQGKVIIYYAIRDEDIALISDELKLKQLFYCPIYLLPDKLQLPAFGPSYRAYLGINELKRELYKNICKADFEAAVILTDCLNNSYCDGAIDDVIRKLFKNNVRNVMTYAYKVWNNYEKDVVRKRFPSLFQHIFDGDRMAIINNQNDQVLVLEQETPRARGDWLKNPGNQLGWKIIPILNENNVLFKLYNVATEKYLQQTSAVKNSEEPRDKFYFEPLLTINGQVAFRIFYFDDDLPLELPVDADSAEDKAVAQNSVGSTVSLTTADQMKEKSVKKDQPTVSDDEEFCNIYKYD